MIGHVSWFAAEKFSDRVIAEMLVPSLLQIDYSRERHYPFDRGFVARQAERKLAACRMTHDKRAIGIEVILLRDLRKKTIGVANILKRSRPATTWIADS